MAEEELPGMDGTHDEAVVVPITDVLDLHPFRPNETMDVVRSYLDEALREGIREVRIIHGRGIGVQRRSLRALLERHDRVSHFQDAPPDAGGWGATLVSLE